MPSNAKLRTGRVGVVQLDIDDDDDSSSLLAAPVEASIPSNPFINDLVDCIENLPNRLQLILTEIRDVDVQVSAQHKMIQMLKQEILLRAASPLAAFNDERPFNSITINQLLLNLHQALVQCQELGDQKIKLTGQVVEMLNNKTRQLGLDPRSNERRLDIELDEDKVISEFKAVIKRCSLHYYHLHHNTGPTNQSRSSRHVTTSNGVHSRAKNVADPKNTSKCKSVSGNSFLLTNNRNKPTAMDAYSFGEDSSNFASPPRTSNQDEETKSLRSLNHQSQSAKSKPSFQGRVAGLASSTDLKQVNKKLKVDLRNSPFNKNAAEIVNNRPKRTLNLSNGTATEMRSLNETSVKKRRNFKQIEANPLSNHCKSPSSSSTASSTNHNQPKIIRTKTPTHKMMLSHSISNSSRLKQQKLNKKLKKRENPTRRGLTENWTSGSDENRAKRRYESRKESRNEHEEYEDSETDDKADLADCNDENDDATSVLSSQNDERNSNETESINHIDNDDDLEEMNTSDNQADYETGICDQESLDAESGDEPMEQESVGPHKPKPISSTNNATANEEEEVYCTCRDISYGNMIFCENSSCLVQWFHFKCVNLSTTPKGRWYCPQCRGDSHKVLKKVPASPHYRSKNS